MQFVRLRERREVLLAEIELGFGAPIVQRRARLAALRKGHPLALDEDTYVGGIVRHRAGVIVVRRGDERLQGHLRLRGEGGVVLGGVAPVRQVTGTHEHRSPLAIAKRHQHHRSLRHSRHRV